MVKVTVALSKQWSNEQSSKGYTLVYYFNLGARWGWVVSAMPRPLYPLETTPVQEAG
jgi:hypothetical protein